MLVLHAQYRSRPAKIEGSVVDRATSNVCGGRVHGLIGFSGLIGGSLACAWIPPAATAEDQTATTRASTTVPAGEEHGGKLPPAKVLTT